MVTPYFSSIRQTLVYAMTHATESIDIAVAWFTNEELFEVLLQKLGEGIKVRIVLINDDINHCGGLDFQRFVDKGGLLYFGKAGYFMHNKYCIVDRKSVFTGSYNYTYFAEHSNFENIVCIADEDSAVKDFIKNYEYILSVADKAINIDVFLKEHPYTVNTHASRQIRNRDLYQKANELHDQKADEKAIIVEQKMIIPDENMDTFVIRDVLYKQWNPECSIRQVKVTQSAIVFEVEMSVRISFRLLGITLYGIGLDKTWHLYTSQGVVPASSISNVQIDGSLIITELDDYTEYYFEVYGNASQRNYSNMASLVNYPSKSVICKSIKLPIKTDICLLSCCISFPIGPYIDEVIDLFEGNENDLSSDYYWHFLRINLLINREFSKNITE